MEQLLVGWVCKALLACGPPAFQQAPPAGVTVYQVNSHPAITQLSYDQIANVGIDCNQKDTIITVLENRVGNQPVMPETLSTDQRRLNAVARSKIWQLRTFCPGSELSNVKLDNNPLTGFATNEVATQRVGDYSEDRYVKETVKYADGKVVVRETSTQIEESPVEIRQLTFGSVVRTSQLPAHPEVSKEFAYRQSKCKWFLETNTAYRDLVRYQGIACQVQPNIWRVIDKF